jgi:aspartyl-tRNA(Asn)/glutamyl-tRNA(Gln) amidotransferase subunit B
MRGKEEAHDYRYFPEPDLPPLSVEEGLVERERSAIPELPAARRKRYASELGLSAYDAAVLTSSRALADFFEAAARLSRAPKEAANWLCNDVLALLAQPPHAGRSIDELPLKPHDLAELIDLVQRGRTGRAGGRAILAAMVESAAPRRPAELLHALGLVQVSSGKELEQWCRAALVGREAAVADVRAGKEKALGALIGPVMQASGGRADPAAVRAELLRLIRGGAA